MRTTYLPGREWPIPPMDKRSGGKPSAFTWAMGRLILQRIADRETMKAITADPRMPAYCTVFQWMRVVPAFGAAVADLRGRLAAERLAARDMRRALRGPKRRSGRRGTATVAMLDAFLARVRDGASVSEATAAPGGPSLKMVYARVRDCPGFRAAFVDACDWRDGWLKFQAEILAPGEVFEIGIAAATAKINRLNARKGALTPKTYRSA
jgi:hypothetical protein